MRSVIIMPGPRQLQTRVLRPIRRKDLKSTLAWHNDPQLRRATIGFPFPVTEVMEEDWIERARNSSDRSKIVFAISGDSRGTIAGIAHLRDIDWIHRTCSLGILIGDKRKQRKGLGRKAVDELLEYAFRILSLRKVCVQVAGYNDSALRLFDSCGFRREGVLRSHVFIEGGIHDMVLMAAFGKKTGKNLRARPLP